MISADGVRIQRIAELDRPNTFTGIAWSSDGRRLAFSQYHRGYLPDGK